MSSKELWDRAWERGPDLERIRREDQTVRWQHIERFTRARWRAFDGLRVIEIGSGHGTNALHYVRRGAVATLLDQSAKALAGASEAAERLGLGIDLVEGDLFDPPAHLLESYDISCSFGLCEHFLGRQRQEVIAAHLRFLRPGGVAIIGVPNTYSFPYRIWMGFMKWRGSWSLGTEVPFTRRELEARIRRAGGRVLDIGYGSFPAAVVDYLVNPFLHNAGRKGFRSPQWRSPLDGLAYELFAFAEAIG